MSKPTYVDELINIFDEAQGSFAANFTKPDFEKRFVKNFTNKEGNAFKQFTSLLGNLKSISYIVKNERNKPLKPETYTNLYCLYLDTLNKIDFLNKHAPKNFDKESDDVALCLSYLSIVTKLTKDHFNAFNAFRPEDCKTIDGMFSITRNNIYNIKDANIKKYGGNQSSRLKMSITLPDNTEREGFFTKTEKFDYENSYKKFNEDFSCQYREFYDKFYSHYLEIAEAKDVIYKRLRKDQLKKENPTYTDKELEEKYTEEIYKPGRKTYTEKAVEQLHKLSDKLLKNKTSTTFEINNDEKGILDNIKKLLGTNTSKGRNAFNYLKKNLNSKNQEFLRSFKYFKEKTNPIVVSNFIAKERLEVQKDADISIRNCAMTSIEKALGMHVLADSHKVTIEKDDGVFDGIFMENADGTDFIALKSDDKRLKIKESEFNNPELLKSIADLQILDYICGNVDRHVGNMFIKFDNTNSKIIGVTGIDNDSSFSRRVPNQNESLHVLMPLEEIKVINKSTAENLKKMDANLLEAILKPYNLSASEISAATKRMQAIKDAINNKDITKATIEVLDDEDWKTYDVEKLKTENNTFTKIANTIKDVVNHHGYSIENEADLNLRAQILKDKANLVKKDYSYFSKKLKSAKSFWKNSDEYNDLVNEVNKLSKKDYKFSNLNLHIFNDNEKDAKETVNSILESIKTIRAKANAYLETKKDEIKADTLNDKSKAKVEVINELLHDLKGKEQTFTEEFALYLKNANNYHTMNQTRMAFELENDNEPIEQTKKNVVLNELNVKNNLTQITKKDEIHDQLEIKKQANSSQPQKK